MPGKHPRGEGISTSLLPEQVKTWKLPTVQVFVNGVECTALVDLGCSQTLVSKAVCRCWRQEEVGVLTADGRTLKCHGYGKIKLGVEQIQPVNVEVLVVDGQLLGFDLLLGIDAIKVLRGIHLTELGEVHFGNLNTCAAILINNPDFRAKFNPSMKTWSFT